MNISNPTNAASVIADSGRSALDGIRVQEQRFERNVAEISKSETTNTQNSGDRNKALVEQNDIANAVKANARSLEVSNQQIGILIDIKV